MYRKNIYYIEFCLTFLLRWNLCVAFIKEARIKIRFYKTFLFANATKTSGDS